MVYDYNTGQIPDERDPAKVATTVGFSKGGDGAGVSALSAVTKRQSNNIVDDFGNGNKMWQKNDGTNVIKPPDNTLVFDFDKTRIKSYAGFITANSTTPEPGTNALLAALCCAGAGCFVRRLRRRG